MNFLTSLALNAIFLEKGEHLRLHGLKIKMDQTFLVVPGCYVKL